MGKKIYPTHHRKYKGGSIKQKNENSFIAYVNTGHQLPKRLEYQRSNFKTYEKALRFIRKECKKHHLQIKNMIYDRGDYYECVLTHDKVMQFDKEDVDKVQDYILHAEKSAKVNTAAWYALTGGGGGGKRRTNFANIIMNHDITNTSITVDHIIPGDGLNNRRSNLRLATKTDQSVNKRISRLNTSGITGVSFAKRKNLWKASWREGKKRRGKVFTCNMYGYEKAKQMAIDYRTKMITESEQYKILRQGR